MKTSRRFESGFTLLEVLVVIAIVSVLAAISMAVFARVREGGRRTVCESNLHQMGLALQQYTSDNNGFYPPLRYAVLTSKNSKLTVEEVKWSDVMQPYLKSTQVFDCPSHKERYPAQTSPAQGYVYLGQYTGDYFYNWFSIRNGGKLMDDKSEAYIANPEKVATVCDAGWVDSAGGLHYMQQVGSSGKDGWQYELSVHSGGANFVFADGHVKWLSAGQQLEEYPYPNGIFDP